MTPFDMALSLVGTMGFGAVGWIATNFVARPLLRVYELRERVWEELLFTANVTVFEGDEYAASVATLRRFAAQASAIDRAWPRYMRRLLQWWRIDLAAAAEGLLGLSNTLGPGVGARADFLRQIEVALALAKSNDGGPDHNAEQGARATTQTAG
jgi:hypothetical protein